MIYKITFFLVFILHIPIWYFVSHGFIHLILVILFKNKKDIKSPKPERNIDFALLITAHQDTKLIPPLVDSIKKQKYNLYKVYIVADDCDIGEIKHLEDENIIILRPEEPLNSKIKSIDYALDNLIRTHDYMIIFDPDNLVDPLYLYALNKYLNTNSSKVVQTRLAPKNTENIISRLDSLGSAYYDFIFRESKNTLGLSAHIYGLGVVIPIDLYKKISYNYLLGGFDKRIQLHIVRSGNKIGYCKDSVVYDEKTSNEKVLQKQRTRWIFSYFKYMKEGINALWDGFKKLNFDIFYFGLESLKPPLIILLLLYLFFGLMDLIFFPSLFVSWSIFLIIFLITPVFIILLSRDYRNNISLLIYIPKFLFIQFTALIGLKKAKGQFLKTDHDHVVYIDEILKPNKNNIE